jgi:peptidoglycan/xylan/chitin deacetylase (PgdA/CDA1 family)
MAGLRRGLCQVGNVVGLTALATRAAGLSGRVPILMYHSIAERQGSDGLSTCLALLGMQVPLETFRRHLDVLGRHHTALSLSTYLAVRARRAALPPGAVVLTFDDGFYDNYQFAAAELEARRFPATFFLIGDCLTGGEPPALHRLYRLIDALDFAAVRVAVGGVRLGPLAIETDSAKSAVLRKLRPIALAGTDGDRGSLFEQLTEAAEQNGRRRPPMQAFLTEADARALVARGFEIGAHSMSHRRLSTIPRADQAVEIGRSISLVRQVAGGSSVPFAYPFGCRGSYAAETRAIVAAAGASCALATTPGLNSPTTDLFALKRLEIRNVSAAEFHAIVSGLASFPRAAAGRLLGRDRVEPVAPETIQ